MTLLKKAAQTKELRIIFKLFRINDIFPFLNYVHLYEERISLVAQMVKRLSTIRETWV